ncbi:MAG TPA: hypothetical protein VFF96_02680 [Pseudoxanthomonas sp.]|nr:hypothetical protein [Pseudoxanthomonas sp.]
MPKQARLLARFSLALVAVGLVGCAKREAQAVTYERALDISREAAKKHGYDLSQYTLDTFGDPAADKGKWLITYQCIPAPPPPSCTFLVAIDRNTGNAEIYPGQ